MRDLDACKYGSWLVATCAIFSFVLPLHVSFFFPRAEPWAFWLMTYSMVTMTIIFGVVYEWDVREYMRLRFRH